jgi:hypothetical protein
VNVPPRSIAKFQTRATRLSSRCQPWGKVAERESV